jgi:hypothetical protein
VNSRSLLTVDKSKEFGHIVARGREIIDAQPSEGTRVLVRNRYYTMKTVQPLQNARQNPFSNPPPKNPLLKVAEKRKNSVSSNQSFLGL